MFKRVCRSNTDEIGGVCVGTLSKQNIVMWRRMMLSQQGVQRVKIIISRFL